MGSGAAQLQRIEFDRCFWEDVSGGASAKYIKPIQDPAQKVK
jgi:hypothetical protein